MNDRRYCRGPARGYAEVKIKLGSYARACASSPTAEEAGALGGDGLAEGAEGTDEGVFWGLVFFGWRGLGGAGFRAVGRGIGDGVSIDWRGTTREMSKLKI